MTDKDVEREIAANEERAKEHSGPHEGKLAEEVDELFSPITNIVDEFGENEDGSGEHRRQNDEEQRPD